MFYHFSRIDAKLPFDYTETTLNHAPNYKHAAASARLLENTPPIAQTVFSYPNVHVKYDAHVLLISLPCQLSHVIFSIIQKIRCTFWIFSSVTASFGRPERLASSVEVRSRSNLTYHVFIAVYDGEVVP